VQPPKKAYDRDLQGQQYSAARGFSRSAAEFAFAAEFAACGGKRGIVRFFATFISNSRFFGLLLIFAIYNTIISSRCKLTFMIIVSENDMTCVNAVNDIHIGIIYDNIFII